MIRRYVHSFAWWLYRATREKGPPPTPSDELLIKVVVEDREALTELTKVQGKIEDLILSFERAAAAKERIKC